MIDTLRLTAEEAMALVERRELSGAELHEAYLDAIAARDDELHCYLRTCEEPSAHGAKPAATAAAEPPDEPPGTRSGSHGFRVGP